MKRELFTNFKHIAGNEPMAQTDFWQWIENHTTKTDYGFYCYDGSFVDAIKEYLKPNGFDIGKHILPAEQLDTYKIVFEHYHTFHWLRFKDDPKNEKHFINYA